MEELLVQIEKHAIQTNFDTIKAELAQTLETYKGIVVDENSIKESKADLSNLRKMRDEIETKRKDIKKEWDKPYQEFKAKCDELTALIDKPISEIKSQLDEFEQKRVAEKQTHCLGLYNECIGEYGDYLPFETIKNPKWDNATYSDKDIKYDISEKVTKVRSEIDAIKALNSEIEDECLRVYRNSGNSLTAAIQKNSDYLSAKSMAEKKIAEERQLEVNPIAPTACQPSDPVDVWADVDAETGEIIPTFTFKVQGNEYIEKVKDFLNFAEIPFIEV